MGFGDVVADGLDLVLDPFELVAGALQRASTLPFEKLTAVMPRGNSVGSHEGVAIAGSSRRDQLVVNQHPQRGDADAAQLGGFTELEYFGHRAAPLAVWRCGGGAPPDNGNRPGAVNARLPGAAASRPGDPNELAGGRSRSTTYRSRCPTCSSLTTPARTPSTGTGAPIEGTTLLNAKTGAHWAALDALGSIRTVPRSEL